MIQRIGLLTLPLHTNYGGILQAIALNHILTVDLGKDVIFLERVRATPNWPMHNAIIKLLRRIPNLSKLQKASEKWSRNINSTKFKKIKLLLSKFSQKSEIAIRENSIAYHRHFIEEFMPKRSGYLISSQSIATVVQNLRIEAVIVGSDQVWRMDYTPDDESRSDFFLGFLPNSVIRKISYAASFGQANWAHPELVEKTKSLLEEFHAISVRESSGVEICAEAFGVSGACQVIDPTLLVDPTFFRSIAAPVSKSGRKILFSYILDQSPDRNFIHDEVRKALGDDYTSQAALLDSGAKSLDVRGWLQAFINADFIITDSFHGAVFATIFKKNFVAIINYERGADRFISLFSQLGLQERLVSQSTANHIRMLVLSPIDFSAVHRKLGALRSSSMRFLRDALR